MKMLNIVLPMAGRGSRFEKAGYDIPKPLIPIYGKPMIQLVIENLTPVCEHKFIFICQKEHLIKFSLESKLKELAPNSEIIAIESITEGAACTVLLAEKFIDNEEQMMIANCDQWIDVDINQYLNSLDEKNSDGLIMTMKADDPKWSFVRFDDSHNVCEVVEKKVVSDEATVGIYNYARGCDFVLAAKKMIEKNLRVNNEFYVAPAYNEMIANGMKLGVYNIGAVLDGMYGLGTPEDLKLFMENGISQRAVKGK